MTARSVGRLLILLVSAALLFPCAYLATMGALDLLEHKPAAAVPLLLTAFAALAVPVLALLHKLPLWLVGALGVLALASLALAPSEGFGKAGADRMLVAMLVVAPALGGGALGAVAQRMKS